VRRWRIAAAAGVLAIPWLGTLLWMQVTGEAADLEAAAMEIMEAADAGKGRSFGYTGEQADSGQDAWNGTGGQEVEGDFAGGDGASQEGGEASADDGGGLQGGSPGQAEGGQGRVRRILMERGGVQTYMTLENYLPGVIVCQMPESPDGTEFGPEVWKSQAVIARTYICRLMEGRSEIHEEELDLDYPGETHSFLGGAKDAAMRRLELAGQAVEATKGVVMKYEDRCILPLFHEMSAGRTRRGHEDFPYIQSVESSQDTKRDGYMTILEWPRAEFASRISRIPEAALVTADQLPQEIQTVEKDDAGYMLKIKIGTRIYTGDEVRFALGLPSACFSLEGEGDMIRARVRGRGHGYGLSQAGADSMAAEGWGYEEILQYYYKNISLISE